MNNIKNKSSLIKNIIVFIVLMSITFTLLLKGENLSNILKTIKTVKTFYFGIGVLSVFIFIICEGLNIRRIFKILNNQIPFIRSLKYAFVGFFFSSITPSASGGQPMQLYYMKKDNINIPNASLTLLVEVAIFQIVTIGIGITSFIFNYNFIIKKISSIWILLMYGVTVNILIVSFIIAAIFSDKLVFSLSSLLIKLLHKIKIVKDIKKAKDYVENQIVEYKEGANLIKKNPKVILKVFATSVIQISAMYSVVFWVYKAFGLNEFSFLSIISLQSILAIAVSSLPLPGAVGASEGSFLILFKTLFPTNVLTSAMLLNRGISFYIFLIISGIVSLYAHFISLKQKEI
ncbi:lysylphosphatidylglycerol synthase transmembrane domain-containing protein [Clostridium sediminicola]|uniref:lysylphosphatidylglycerol synthase transmembrane domain-containing protein n=1 Tax=Clostridium sediminicola TaxID=3114879 RepID=UPI0031F1E7E7